MAGFRKPVMLPKKSWPAVGDVVQVDFPHKDGAVVGPGEVRAIGRQAQGKKYDIEIRMSDGRQIFCNGKHIKPTNSHTPQTTKPEPKKDVGAHKPYDAMGFPEHHKLPICSNCNNGNLYVPGGPDIWKDHINDMLDLGMIANCTHIILVPAVNIVAKRTASYCSKKVEVCERCKGGHYIAIEQNKKDRLINHRMLARRGIKAIIKVPTKR